MSGTLSETRQEILKVIWEFDDFLSWPPGSFGSCIKSPAFRFSDSLYRLGVYPLADKRHEGAAELYLFSDKADDASSPSSSSSTVIFSLAVKKADGTFSSQSPSSSEPLKIPNLGFGKMLTRSDLEEKKDEFLPRDTLIFSCILRKVPPVEAIDGRSANLKKLLKSSAHSDVTVKLQSREYRAHRAILAAHSKVFAAALEHDTLEKESGVIQIKDCDPDSFQEFLQYLYTGCADINESNVFHLYKTADKYLVGELREICVAYIIENMSVGTVCDAVALADDHKITDLKWVCRYFFSDKVVSILGTSKWISLLKERSVAADQLLQYFATRDAKLGEKQCEQLGTEPSPLLCTLRSSSVFRKYVFFFICIFFTGLLWVIHKL